MARHLRHNAFANSTANISGLEWQIYSTTLDEGDSFEDLFQPGFWRHHASGRLHQGDEIRVRAADSSFDVYVTVRDIVPGGAQMDFSHGRLPAKYHGMHSDEIRDLLMKDETQFEVVKMDREGKPIPRIEQLPTGWRVVGNDNEVVEHSIRSKAAADNRFDKYLRDLALRMPTPAEMAAHKAEHEARDAEQSKATHRKSPKA